MGSLGFFFLDLLLLLAGSAFSLPISYDLSESRGSIGRTLLQQKEECPVDFENLDYSNITRQCKGPNYTPKSCCPPFKELACPYLDQINDLKTVCATTLFSYLNIHGNYPPGLFGSLCREGKEGLDCTDILARIQNNSKTSQNQNGAFPVCDHYPVVMLLAYFLTLLFIMP